jgi:hypothetical protein
MENTSYKTKTEKDLRVTYIYKSKNKKPQIIENKKTKLQVGF